MRGKRGTKREIEGWDRPGTLWGVRDKDEREEERERKRGKR
jgi:hypothetical protein